MHHQGSKIPFWLKKELWNPLLWGVPGLLAIFRVNKVILKIIALLDIIHPSKV